MTTPANTQTLHDLRARRVTVAIPFEHLAEHLLLDGTVLHAWVDEPRASVMVALHRPDLPPVEEACEAPLVHRHRYRRPDPNLALALAVLDHVRGQRDRYRLAWTSARRRANDATDTIYCALTNPYRTPPNDPHD